MTRTLVCRLCAMATATSWPAIAGGDMPLNMTRGVTAISREVYDLHMLIFYICCGVGLLVFAEERPHRGLIRLPDCPPAERIAIIGDLLARHRADLEQRAVITVRGGRVRISRSSPPG